jgi:hypothetical protein
MHLSFSCSYSTWNGIFHIVLQVSFKFLTLIEFVLLNWLAEKISLPLETALLYHSHFFWIADYVYVHLQEEVARDLGIPVNCQRFWLWAKRQNHTYRPNRPLNEHEESQTVRAMILILFLACNLSLKMYMSSNIRIYAVSNDQAQNQNHFLSEKCLECHSLLYHAFFLLLANQRWSLDLDISMFSWSGGPVERCFKQGS